MCIYLCERERIRKTQGDRETSTEWAEKERFQMNVILHYLAILKTI